MCWLVFGAGEHAAREAASIAREKKVEAVHAAQQTAHAQITCATCGQALFAFRFH